MVTVERLAGYLRAQQPAANVDDPDSLALYLAAAKSRARSSGVPEYANNADYDLFILALAAMEYDNRGFGDPIVDPAKAERMINGFVLRLRHAGEDPEPDPPPEDPAPADPAPEEPEDPAPEEPEDPDGQGGDPEAQGGALTPASEVPE